MNVKKTAERGILTIAVLGSLVLVNVLSRYYFTRLDLTRDLGYRYPGSEDPGADHALAELCAARLDHRYVGGRERQRARRRLEEELEVIRSLRLSGFFLLHFDILER